ncbi:gntP permease [Escherichia coli]|uniref:GntT/GntP/DsdX family permease n=1 Tax=Escherichia coli TaxID=562 RepID=UPI0004D505A3|nr:SLC13 family permease [Escherichia coli]KEJ76040.1 inner membrane permease ygbN [Escherichia coli 6-175-07_S3_C2]KEM00441.1 inner membrane permease ygbN [Escherichia coli 6-175-07_S3_C3]KEM20324.1 inner membrane permease ygbN [Escherichia coli 6-319-05_S3_C1]KEM29174.1 inner membrane permease ygbN [Escherichia coli 6-319-05_S3_C2]MBW2889330.1 gntP permease [Escherichia coli]
MSTITLLCIAGVIMLLLLVIKAKVQPFVALLLVSLLVALAAGIPAGEVGKVMIAGMGGVLGSVTIIIGLGAMLGRMIEHSGGAESLANYFSRKLGDKRTIAALTLAAFFLGIPVFFDVGFIILAPIIYGFAKVAKISPLKFGLPVAGIMLTVHVAVVILVTGAGGVFGKVLVESGVGKALANMLQMIDLPLLPAAFIISLALRASQGSATVAILTTGGLLSEAVMGLNPIQCVLVTLAACFGGLGASHINDSGFWIVTKYLGLSVADGLKTWTVLTTILGFTGFLITWCVWLVI